jgi:putative transposase
VSRPKPRLNSLRLESHDYTKAGAYFVTVVVYEREAILGSVINNEMELSQYGTIVTNVWKDLPNRYSHIVLDEFIIMPDHIHGIISIHNVGAGSLLTLNTQSVDNAPHDTNKPALGNQQETSRVGLPRAGFKYISNQFSDGHNGQSVNEPAPTKNIHGISEIIRNFKTVSAKRINLLRKLPNTPVWQRGFHDRIIRNEEELNTTRQYIQTNPLRWSLDQENQPL